MKQLSSLPKISVSLLLLFFSLTASAGDPYRPGAGAAEAGTGYTCIMKEGFWSSFHNQANLAGNKSFSIGFNYEDRFNVSELSTRSAAFILPAGKVSFGAIYSHFGYTDYKRDMAGLACGMKLSQKFSAGIQIDYYSAKTSGEYSTNDITAEAGLTYQATENTRIAVHIFNPVPGGKAYMPARLRIGASTFLNKSLFAGVETEMSTGSKLIIRTGFEYEALKNLRLRGGYGSENNSFSFGFGYEVKMVQIDIGFVTHEKLGVSSSLSLIFKL